MNAMPAAASSQVSLANDRFKQAFRSRLWASLIAATVVHFMVFALWPELSAPDISAVVSVPTTLELPPEVDIPDAPEPLSAPALPVPTDANVPDEITMARTTLEANPVSELPPPPESAASEDLSTGPRFVPMTVPPQILNVDEVVRALQREYPPLLRDAGIGGTVRVYFFVGDDGAVLDTRLHESSGHGALDDAALKVASLYRFSPALNRDTKVAVWVSFPITFEVR